MDSIFFNNSKILADNAFDGDGIDYRSVNNVRSELIWKDSDLKYHTIKPEQQYRPDKISDELYGSPDFTWILDEVNFFKHPFKEYLNGRKIQYLSIEYLESRGINT